VIQTIRSAGRIITPTTIDATTLLSALTIPVDAVNDQKTRYFYNGRGQQIGALDAQGYLTETGIAVSSTETFAGLRLYLDNWRWKGVPFYLRSGKRLGKRVSEIAVTFRAPPHLMFGHHGNAMRPNTLVMRVQPNEGVSLNFEVKVPGVTRGRGFSAWRIGRSSGWTQLRKTCWSGAGVPDG